MKLQVGVKVLIKNKQHHYLFLQRTKTFNDASEPHWDIPGGRINPDEPLLEALAREVYEETGLRISSQPHLLAAQDIFVASANLHVVRLTYQVQGEGTPVLSHEHQETKWMSSTEALQSALDPYIAAVLEQQKNAH